MKFIRVRIYVWRDFERFLQRVDNHPALQYALQSQPFYLQQMDYGVCRYLPFMDQSLSCQRCRVSSRQPVAIFWQLSELAAAGGAAFALAQRG